MQQIGNIVFGVIEITLIDVDGKGQGVQVLHQRACRILDEAVALPVAHASDIRERATFSKLRDGVIKFPAHHEIERG